MDRISRTTILLRNVRQIEKVQMIICLVFLYSQHKFGDILVPQAKLELLRGKSASLYTQELAVLVFGKETLEDCCLTGSTSKRPLPTAAVNDIVGQ